MSEDRSRFPIGLFRYVEGSVEIRKQYGEQIRTLVPELRGVLAELGEERLDAAYRPGGWTIRQVIHHMADNDMNAYIRLRRALTEEEPVAASYREDLWAGLHDYRETPVEISLQLLEALHTRIVYLIRDLTPEDYTRGFTTQALGGITVDIALQRFVWHNRHHMAQIKHLNHKDK